MPDSRRVFVWDLVAARAATRGSRVSVGDVCAVAVSAAGVGGAWVSAASSRGPDFVVCVTDPVSEQLAEVQLVLGEGPCHDVLATAAPVLAGDLGDDQSMRRWPGFTAEARQLGAGAVFAFPLMIGAIRAGVMGLYRSSPGPLPGAELGDCLLLGDAATVLLLDGADHGAGGAAGVDGAGPGGQSPDLARHPAAPTRTPMKTDLNPHDAVSGRGVACCSESPVRVPDGRRILRAPEIFNYAK